MIDRHHALVFGRDHPALSPDALVPNTYRPDCAWRDLRVAERDGAMRAADVMAYPEPRARWTDWLGLAAAVAFEAACWLGVGWLAWRVWHG